MKKEYDEGCTLPIAIKTSIKGVYYLSALQRKLIYLFRKSSKILFIYVYADRSAKTKSRRFE